MKTTMTVVEYRQQFSGKRGYGRTTAAAPKKRRAQPEHDEQAKVIAWARTQYAVDPIGWHDLDLLHCSLNGVKLSKAQAGKALAAGMLKGVLDLSLPVPIGPYHSLYIEMKYGDNTPTKEQLDIAGRLEKMGHKVHFCWSAQEAIDAITNYYGA